MADTQAMDWQAAAAERIDRVRKGDFVIRVVDQRGRPIADAMVTAAMTRHAFAFGTTINARHIEKIDDEQDPYLQHAAALFNHGSLENSLKWNSQETANGRARADRALAWMADQGWTIHGHVLVWATTKYGPPMPPDVANKLAGEDADRGAYALRRSLDHIAETGRYYRGRIAGWDVVNEHFSEHVISEALHGKDEVALETSPELVAWFKTAREAAPDALLFINDFGILVADQTRHKDSYEKTIRYLIDQGAPIGGIGMQAHYIAAAQQRTPQQLMHTLDRFAALGLKIQITEFDMFGGGWGETPEQIEATQAQYLRTFYTVCFSHPAVDGITMWGFWDGRHWRNSSPLFRKDWSAKPGLDVYRDLVFNQWWTHETGRTDASGTLQFRGFRGDYRLTVKVGDTHVQRTVTLDADSRTITLVVKSE
jgi:GH35 family endo-1,4-beta-xylanase